LQLTELLSHWLKDSQFATLLDQIRNKNGYRVEFHGLDGSAGDYFLAALTHYSGRPLLLVTADQAGAEKAYSNLDAFLPGQVRLLPARELFVSPMIISRSEEIQHQRLRFMQWLLEGTTGIYVAPLAALLSRNLLPDQWQNLTLKLSSGDRLNREDLIGELVARGYERSSLAEVPGQFSARGDIVDIFSPGLGRPIRLELFDQNLESVRFYDPQSQRSIEKTDLALIIPARELLLSDDRYLEGQVLIKSDLEKALSQLRKRGEKEAAAMLNQQVSRDLERLASPEGLDLLSGYFSYFYGAGSTLLDYLPQVAILALKETASLLQKENILRADLNRYYSDSYAAGILFGQSLSLLWSFEELFSRHSGHLVVLNAIADSSAILKTAASQSLDTLSASRYHGQWELFHADLQHWQKNRYQVYLAAASEERVNSLAGLLEEQLPNAPDYIRLSAVPDDGFIIPALRLALVTEQNLLPGRKKKRRVSSREGTLLGSYKELSAGDYVVHEQHGIGQFQGIHTLAVSGIERDYLLLKYRGTDKLYIPIDQVSLIRKYSGGESPAPHLHSLGGAEWQRIKRKVTQSVEDLARELLELYAARQTAGGYRFGPDHPWQQEFEARFPFEETPDQLQAIAEVKADLEKDHPMDRLICGDVGYGKTEVAMRAAFKVMLEGKQVAIMVPTTVLAQQHYRTFQERFEGFPVQIAQLSRFVPPARQKEIFASIAAGKIDLVIGTHRLLAKDLRFHDLGLLIIDEEQRFGVRQKEKIKKMRLEVDTLAMTATPIPRTLHLSLAGARDLSIIDTPPEDRYPVQTYVLEYSENLIREVVQRELNRQGQVFIVFNRVQQIDTYAAHIEQLFPEAAVTVGHGQMPEARLEKVMVDFQEGRYQILVSSTIIESGLDIPNVNTLIVCDADRFGLAQLYQIRGRVGRSNRLAYAYLTYRKDKLINETARKRLKAIREFTELGSGFKIALRDLEIRGAGNILGAEQHGFIAAVGFDLYVRMLDQAVALLKNVKVETKIEPRLELNVSAYLPSSYIASQDQKIDFYQKIYSADSLEELSEIEEELIDRFASPPEPGRLLLEVARIRIRAAEAGIELISRRKNSVVLEFSSAATIKPAMLDQHPPVLAKRISVTGLKPLKVKISGLVEGTAYLADLLLEIENILALRPA
jgi:transcription-repair coupling factor (superfamily II helicase)